MAMKTYLALLAGFTAIFVGECIAAARNTIAQVDPVQKLVRFIVTHPDGSPASSVPVFAAGTTSLPAVSDATGRAECTIQIPVESEYIRVGVSWTRMHQEAFPGVYPRGYLDWQAECIAERINFEYPELVPVPAGAEVAVQVTLHPGVTITGRVTDAGGAPQSGGVFVRGGSVSIGATVGSDTGTFTLHGVRAGVEAELYIVLDDGRLIRRMVSPALADLDCGNIVVESDAFAPQGEVLAQIVVPEPRPPVQGVGGGIMFIQQDTGQIYLGAAVGPDRFVYASFADREPKRLPVGSYFMIPSLFTGAAWQIELLDAIRDGNIAITQSLQTVTVVEGELKEITVQASDAMPAIEQVLPAGS